MTAKFSRHAAGWLIICLGSLLLFSAQSPAGAAPTKPLVTATLIPAADAFIADKQPGTKFGQETLLRLGYDPSFGSMQSLLRFVLSDGVPAKAVIEEARLELYVASASPTFDPPLATDVYRVTEPWSEILVSWGNRPTIGSLAASGTIGRDANFYSWDVTNLVRDWYTNPGANHGLQLISDANAFSVRSRALYAREIGGGLFPPRLIVRFNIDNTPPVAEVQDLPFYSPKSFPVNWSGSDSGGSGIDHYDVQIREDNGSWVDWQVNTAATSATYTGPAGRFVEFRARAVDKAGNVQAYTGGAQAFTFVGVATATMNVISPSLMSTSSFPISWTGHDHGGSPITAYFIYAAHNRGAYTIVPNMNGINTTSAIFTANGGDGLYSFQALAKNQDGIQETLTAIVETEVMVDAAAPFITPRQYFPFMAR